MCAVRDLEDVAACVDGGADAVGVLVGVRHRADDAVDVDAAVRLLEAVPPYVGRYGVTHLSEPEDLVGLVARLPVDSLQLHDDVTPDTLRLLRRRFPYLQLVKALPVTDEVPSWGRFADWVSAFVLDSVDPDHDRIGGTGLIHDWTISAAVADISPRPVILAGGLRADNVAEAIDIVRPWAVNVNSGVETDGCKDPVKVRAFVETTRRGRPS